MTRTLQNKRRVPREISNHRRFQQTEMSSGMVAVPFPSVSGAAAQHREVIFPSSPRRGGRDINKMTRSLLSGADGVVNPSPRVICFPILQTGGTTPSARLRKLRSICLIAQPPLLGEEGKNRLESVEQQPRKGRAHSLPTGATYFGQFWSMTAPTVPRMEIPCVLQSREK
jgi:hypothetical protein